MSIKILTGDCREVLRTLPSESVHCVVTSPPYWGLRDYGTAKWEGGDAGCDHVRQSALSRLSSGLGGATTTQGGVYAWKDECGKCGASRIDSQLGLEPTYQEYVASMVAVFREVRRVLRKDGTVWLVLGDSYCSGDRATWRSGASEDKGQDVLNGSDDPSNRNKRSVWEVATAPFPEAHFATFPPALVEPCIKAGTSEKGCCAKCGAPWRRETESTTEFRGGSGAAGRTAEEVNAAGKWAGKQYGTNIKLGPCVTTTTVGWSPSCSCNAATVPCTVLDPFGGAGTTGLVADRLGRDAIMIELNPEYAVMAERRIRNDAGMFAEVAAE